MTDVSYRPEPSAPASTVSDSTRPCSKENSVTDSVSLDYRLEQNGWASFTLTVGIRNVEVGKFGYCTDALGDLIRAALMVATGGSFASVSFDAEPREWRILLGTEGSWNFPSNLVPLRVKTFPDAGVGLPEIEGVMIFEAEVHRDEFARAVLAAAQTIFKRHGTNGYEGSWNFMFSKFPTRALHALETIVSTIGPALPVLGDT